MERDCDEIWTAAVGKDIRKDFDAVLRLYASYDETGVWQEFGEMKFASKDDIPAEWGNPDPAKPRWIPTRYVAWTSWLAGAQQWGLSSMRQGENSGTITHELGHFAFRLPDLNNNPYVQPYRRVAAGTWDMMDRGCFNGPGGPHKRWVVPPMQGAFMPAGLMVRNRLENKFIDETALLTLGRAALAAHGLAVADVTARAVDPLPGTYTGLVVKFDGEKPGDLTPPDDPATNPLSAGTPNYSYYTLEVVQRIGYDSFTPDNGVLLAKNKDGLRGRNGGPNEFNSYIWVIDAHPEDINEVDYVRPGRRKGHADRGRLPPAQRRPFPRRARFRKLLRMGGLPQPPSLLCHRPPQGQGRDPRLHPGRPFARRRRAAAARRGHRAAGEAVDPQGQTGEYAPNVHAGQHRQRARRGRRRAFRRRRLSIVRFGRRPGMDGRPAERAGGREGRLIQAGLRFRVARGRRVEVRDGHTAGDVRKRSVEFRDRLP